MKQDKKFYVKLASLMFILFGLSVAGLIIALANHYTLSVVICCFFIGMFPLTVFGWFLGIYSLLYMIQDDPKWFQKTIAK